MVFKIFTLICIEVYYFALWCTFLYCITSFRTLAHFVALLSTKCETSYSNIYIPNNAHL